MQVQEVKLVVGSPLSSWSLSGIALLTRHSWVGLPAATYSRLEYCAFSPERIQAKPLSFLYEEGFLSIGIVDYCRGRTSSMGTAPHSAPQSCSVLFLDFCQKE